MCRNSKGEISSNAQFPLSQAASFIALSDLDEDGAIDLVGCQLKTGRALGGETAAAQSAGVVFITWGTQQGFDDEDITQFDVPYASALAVADFDGDGRKDVIVTPFQSEQMFQSQPVIFRGRGKRRFDSERLAFDCFGPTDAQSVMLKAGEQPWLVICNTLAGTVNERVPVRIQWGGADGFASDRHTDIPFASAYEASAADLNDDAE